MNNKLRIGLAQVMTWFNVNHTVLNADKCHYICLSKATEK